jgi:hypothetical protein
MVNVGWLMSYEFTLYIKASWNLCSVIAGHIILCNYFSISTSGNSVFMVGLQKNGKPCSLKVALIFCCVKPVGESIIKIGLALGSHLLCPYFDNAITRRLHPTPCMNLANLFWFRMQAFPWMRDSV